jgi:DNA-binding protein
VSNQNYVLLVLTLGDTEFSQFGLHSQGKFICKVI